MNTLYLKTALPLFLFFLLSFHAFSQCGSIREDDRYAFRGSWDVLVLIVDWPDKPATESFDLSKHQETARQIDEWFQEQSMCRIKVNFTIVDQYIRMPHPTTYEPYLGKNDNAWKLQMNDAIAEAQKINPAYSLDNYTVFMDFPVATTFSGYGGLGRVWSPFTNGKVARHELAHVFHINHEDNPEGDIGNVLGPFSRYRASWIFGQDEYGFKSKWFYTAGGIGEYRLYDYRSSQEVPQGLRMMRVQNKLYDLYSTLNIFYDGDPASKGVVMYEEKTNDMSSITRLDFTPNSKSGKLDDFNDGNLQLGKNYYYEDGNIRIDVVNEVAATATTPAYVELNVKYGSSSPDNDLSNVFLKSLTTDPAGEFEEPFDKRKTGYTLYLPEGTTEMPAITAVPEDPLANVVIDPAKNLTGSNSDRTAKITVEAQDGVTELWYFITFWVGDPPKGTDAHLFELNVSQGTLEPTFDLFTFDYNVTLPQGTSTVPTVSAKTNDENATYEITQAKSLTGSEEDRTATVVVTAEDGTTTKTYTVLFAKGDVTQGFTLKASPASLSIPQGAFDVTGISYDAIGGFANNVDLTVDQSSLPDGVTAKLNSSSINDNSSASLRLDISPTAKPIISPVDITINGVSGDITSSVNIALTITEVTNPDFSIIAEPSALSASKGNQATSTITISPLKGFAEAVSLVATANDPGISLSLDASVIQGNGSTLLSIEVLESVPVRDAIITITATSGNLQHQVTINLEITEPPLELNPHNQFSPNGDLIDDVWIIENIETMPNAEVIVFNRVGQEVYRKTGYKNDWDGTSHDGNPLIPSAYYFVIKDQKGRSIKIGSVNLIR